MPIETDALVIGAGPVGLFQVFQLGLQGVHAHVVDALPHVGGQCVELYADKPIYDIPGIAVCTGRELAERLTLQIAPFAADFHLGQRISTIERQSDGRYFTASARTGEQALQFLAKTIFIAAGVGAFEPRRLNLPGLDALEGRSLHHSLAQAPALAGSRVAIVGDGDAALEAALQLCAAHPDGHADKAARVTLLHRRDAFSADPATVARLRALIAAGAIEFVAGQVSGVDAPHGQLQHLDVLLPDARTQRLAVDQLLVLQGLSPKLGPVAQWGLDMERRQLQVDTATFATSAPGIFAVGDINTYPGKKKLIVCGFHECVLAAFAAMAVIAPDEKVLLQYTTTSSRLHQRLGVEHPGAT